MTCQEAHLKSVSIHIYNIPDDNFISHFELQNKKERDSFLIQNVLPEYFRDKDLNDKLEMIESNELSDDNIHPNLLADDSYIEPDSFSNLDQEHKAQYLDKRLSILMNAETDSLNTKSPVKSKLYNTPNIPTNSRKTAPNSNLSKIIQNEKLLDALDKMDDCLVDEPIRFSFARISFLDISDRNSIIHGPSFVKGKEMNERISMRKSSKL
jgi:hypothetical protein